MSENETQTADLQKQRGDETWPVPESWVGEDLLFAYRDTLMMSEGGPQFISIPGTLVADLGSSLHIRSKSGELVLPKCIIQQVIKPSSIVSAQGLPGGLKH